MSTEGNSKWGAPGRPAESDGSDRAPVVGLGASAGGLAAFEAFFSGLPPDLDPGMAFVLVQHLDPDHVSLLPELIRRHTHLTVLEVEDEMPVEPNTAYVAPPGKELELRHGKLRLRSPAGARGHRLPIDVFFRSLAEDLGEKAVGVVLSGTGSDGTEGIRALKASGGLVLAQDTHSTEHAGMARSAIATGLVDVVLPAQEMAGWLVANRSSYGASGRTPERTPAEKEALQDIYRILRDRTGHDFSQYKETSIRRRLERRMAEQRVAHVGDYVRYLREARDEAEILCGDLLIGVTQFFRDPQAFAALSEKGLPRVLEGRPNGSAFRVWVPACSTGEEAYSVAILVREYLDASGRSLRPQIFATDLDPRAIEVARAGVYPSGIAEDVTFERLTRFFTREEDGSYRISKSIREIMVFSEQDVIMDPPFSRIDLVSCRNLLIYLGAESQRKLTHVFHYALNPSGLLLLGTSETVGDAADRFEVLDRSAKLYQRKDAPIGAPRPVSFTRHAEDGRAGVGRRSVVAPSGGVRSSLQDLTERALLAHDVPAAALVNASGEILYLHGRTGNFLEPAAGEVGMNILEMAREGLKRGLAGALHSAATTNERVLHPPVRVRANGHSVTVSVSVQPVSALGGEGTVGGLFLVTLQELPGSRARPTAAPESAKTKGAKTRSSGKASTARAAALEEELHASERYLRAVEEEMQTSNEAFRASIEELQSTNEELQSTNEELETSKEELQSLSEELTTINAELEAKVEELSRVENDMSNLLSSTGIGTVFVDLDLRIQRFTPTATEILNLIPSDVGRPVSDLTSRLEGYDGLRRDAKAVLDTLIPRDIEVRRRDGAWYLLRIRPYRTVENVIQGAVITFTDISEVQEARATLREAAALQRLAVVVKDSHDAITVQDLNGNVRAWNPGAERMFGWTEAEALRMPYIALVPQDGREEARLMLDGLLQGRTPEPMRSTRLTKAGQKLTVWTTATPLLDSDGAVYAVAVTERRTDSRSS